mgnify:CR=1 FL=1
MSALKVVVLAEPARGAMSSSEIPSQTEPLTTEQITAGMRVLGNTFDLYQQLAEALRRD